MSSINSAPSSSTAAAPSVHYLKSNQLKIQWDHGNSLLLEMHEAYIKQKMTDVTIVCEGQLIKTHKVVLSTAPYFRKLFMELDPLTPNPVVCIAQIKYKCMQVLVEFLYKGDIEISTEDIQDLRVAAEFLQMPEVTEALAQAPQAKPCDTDTAARKEPEPSTSCDVPQVDKPVGKVGRRTKTKRAAVAHER